MAAAADAGLDVIALTDHDTTEGWAEAEAAATTTLVRGAEISCKHGGISLHLLAYLFDPSDEPLSRALDELRDSRVSRAERMVELLVDDGHPVTWEQVRGLAGGTVGRPHIGQALIAAGLVGSLDEAFSSHWIGTGGRYWSGKLEIDVMEAIGLVKEAGGVSVFAHPAAAARGRIVSEDAIRSMALAGLDGLEVAHPDHPPATQERLRDLAAELGLLVTGSSDFHGSNKEVALGAHLTEAHAFNELVSRASGVPVVFYA